MSLADYVGKSQFWDSIKVAVGTQLITAEILYDQGIKRTLDRGRWVYDQLVALRIDIASQVRGTHAVKQGSVDLSTLNFDDISGDLNSLTVLAQADTGGLKTCTFGTGAGFAPTDPADVVSQLNVAFAGQPVASLDVGNKLMIKSTTTGGTSTITTPAGTALALLGMAVGAGVPGAATGNSGAEQVGVPAIVGSGSILDITAGTLFDVLKQIADKFSDVPLLSAATNAFLHNLSVAGTFTSSGGMTCSGVNALTGITTCSNNFTVSGAGKTTLLSQDTILVSGLACTISSPTCTITNAVTLTIAATTTCTGSVTHSSFIARAGNNATLRERDPLVVAPAAAATAITTAYDSVQVIAPSVDQVWTLPVCPSYATEIECLVFNMSAPRTVGIKRNGAGGNVVFCDSAISTYSFVKFKSSNVNGGWAWAVSSYGGGANPDETAAAF